MTLFKSMRPGWIPTPRNTAVLATIFHHEGVWTSDEVANHCPIVSS